MLFASGCLFDFDSSKDYTVTEMKTFQSEEELASYLKTLRESFEYELNSNYYNLYYGVNADWADENSISARSLNFENGRLPQRINSTDIQLKNSNEADIVRISGNVIYYTPDNVYLSNERPFTKYHAEKEMIYDLNLNTYEIDIEMPQSASVFSEIAPSGDIFIDGNILVATDSVSVMAYDIKNPAEPKLMWEKNVEGNYSFSSLYDGKFYTVVRQKTYDYPLVYMNTTVPFSDVYYSEVSNDFYTHLETVYYISQLNLSTGDLEECIAVIGQDSSYNRKGSFIYSAEDDVYLVNSYFPREDRYAEFLVSHGSDYFPKSFIKEIKQILKTPDFTEYAKEDAVSNKIENYTADMTDRERQSFMEEIDKGYNQYLIDEGKGAEQSVVIQIHLPDLSVDSGVIPGSLVDGRSMDKKDGYLRVATTAGNENRYMPANRNNGVYIFNSKMDLVGSLNYLLLDDYVTSACFIEDSLHLIRPNESSPRLVIDLSNPNNPELAGDLFIFGYSVYLQPIKDNIVLGINQTKKGQLQLTLFNISNKTVPKELDSYVSGDILTSWTYHTFSGYMFDEKRNILLVPSSSGVSIFEIKNNTFNLLKEDTHRNGTVIRAVFVDNMLYTFSEKEVHVIETESWNTLKVISIPQPNAVYYERDYAVGYV
ncbi:hypothetical protein MmiEs2_06980 [Methanimicrococcus stummii]|uniref:Uncharacterized protein n=2 Tax=Methanimicrococcus stummii TaxID=3028294 RepID=A0AA96V844_9EURY|nr:hypothetical protein MmiEs2_06980 [Methanimicrococcus sp. Es2]